MSSISTTSLESLMNQAQDIRDRNFGSRVTYSPKVFIPLTYESIIERSLIPRVPSPVTSPKIGMFINIYNFIEFTYIFIEIT